MSFRPDPFPLPQSQTEYALVRYCTRKPDFGGRSDPFFVLKKVVDLFHSVMRMGIFILQPNLFALGFMAGIIWDDTCYYAVERTKAVWNSFTLFQKVCAGLASIVALPVIILTGYFMYSASLGSHFHHELNFN